MRQLVGFAIFAVKDEIYLFIIGQIKFAFEQVKKLFFFYQLAVISPAGKNLIEICAGHWYAKRPDNRLFSLTGRNIYKAVTNSDSLELATAAKIMRRVYQRPIISFKFLVSPFFNFIRTL